LGAAHHVVREHFTIRDHDGAKKSGDGEKGGCNSREVGSEAHVKKSITAGQKNGVERTVEIDLKGLKPLSHDTKILSSYR
jgi:hypothetical protein